ncbi:hypothetical protein GWN28_21520, partial [candidate division KSB1 bacterium]|nr:hypothetical protein [candidate division KSB1 bacterium]NIW20885.1 hypothetical protein [candidate division KSB1 bacterium]
WKVTYQQPGQSRITEPLSGLTGNEILRIRRHISGLTQYRYSLEIYPEKKTAVLSLRTFTGTDLKPFFREAFRKIRKEKTEYLIID